jgi:hypothetical protein
LRPFTTSIIEQNRTATGMDFGFLSSLISMSTCFPSFLGIFKNTIDTGVRIIPKLISVLLIYAICLISLDCGTENTKIRHTGTTENPTQTDEDNSLATYRVQIGILDNKTDADKLAKYARSNTDYPVYVEYITPFYRVRVGDFVRKSDAEKCVIFLQKKGFSDARYVFSDINSQRQR